MVKLKYDYFDAFERIAEYASQEAELLNNVLNNFSPDKLRGWIEEIHEIENLSDEINHTIYKNLANEFVPPIEREDIIIMAQQLDDIVDDIDDVAQLLYMFNIQEIPEPAILMGELIEKACSALREALKDFKNFKKSKDLDRLIVSVSDYEEEADKVYFKANRDLFVNKADDALYVMAWYHIIVRMERCVDATAHAADTVATVIMKNT